MSRPCLVSAALTLSLLSAAPAPAGEATAARVVVADREAGRATVVDLDAGRVLATLPLPGPAGYLVRGADAGEVFAIDPKGGTISRIGTGIRVEEHGDHADLSLGAPEVAPAVLSGERPTHLNFRRGIAAAYLDGTGEALLLPRSELGAPAAAPVRVAANMPHHGVALPAGADVLVSVAETQGDRAVPVGMALMARDGSVKAEWRTCPRLHGEAVVEPDVLVGCQDGVLALRGGQDGVTARKIAYPADAGEARVFNLEPVPGMTAALGEGGRDGLFLVDTADDVVTRIALPGDRVHAIPDPAVFAHALVLTADGRLHRVSLLDGTVTAGAGVTGPVDLANRSGPPRPSVAAAEGHVVVLDAARGELVRLDPATLAETARLKIDGTPARMVAVGARGAKH